MVDFSHLDTLNLSLSRARGRVASAKSESERSLRGVWVQQLEKEIANERSFLGQPEEAKIEAISDDDLLAELGM